MYLACFVDLALCAHRIGAHSSATFSGARGLSITFDDDGTRCTFRLEGEIDITLAADLKAKLLSGLLAAKPIRVDLSEATELDVIAMQLLWVVAREAEKQGVPCWFVGVSAATRFNFQAIGLESFLTKVSRNCGAESRDLAGEKQR